MLVKSAELDIPGTEVEEVVDFRGDVAGAHARTRFAEYAPNSSHTCLLHEEWRPSTSRLDEDDMIWPYEQGWTPWEWVVMGVFAAWLAVGIMCLQSGLLSSFDACSHTSAGASAVVCWCGVIVPFCIFLPVSNSRAVEEDTSGATAAKLRTTAWVLGALFAGTPLLALLSLALRAGARAVRQRFKAAQVRARRRQSLEEERAAAAAVAAAAATASDAGSGGHQAPAQPDPYRHSHVPAPVAATPDSRLGGDFDPFADADKAYLKNKARYGAPGGLV